MKYKNINTDIIITCTLYFVFNIIFIVHNYYYPQAYDALHYQEIAKSCSYANDTRLYGYTLFLSLFYTMLEAKFAIYAATICQIFLYFFAVFYFLSQVAKANTRKLLLYSLLVLNIFLYPYLSLTLTDGMTVSLLVIILALLLSIFTSKNITNNTIKIFLVGLVIGYSLMVRPAYIFLAICFPLFFSFIWMHHGIKKSLTLTGICCGGFILAVLPQLLINIIVFDKTTFFPAIQLGDRQIGWGIAFLKYATNLSDAGPAGMYYLNPYINEITKGGTTLVWYIQHPVVGLKTVFMHIFGSLDFDYLFPYIYDIDPDYRLLLFILSQTIIYFSIFGYFQTWRKREEMGSGEQFFYLILLPAIIVSWALLTGIVVPENRFSLPAVTILLPFAVYGSYSFYKNKLIMLGFGSWLLGAWQLSTLLDSCKILL